MSAPQIILHSLNTNNIINEQIWVVMPFLKERTKRIITTNNSVQFGQQLIVTISYATHACTTCLMQPMHALHVACNPCMHYMSHATDACTTVHCFCAQLVDHPRQ